MIFKEILDKKTAALQPEFDKFINDAFRNQTHLGDLLLTNINGFFDTEVEKWDNINPKPSPYVIGPGDEGHSEALHHEFIGDYLKSSMLDQEYDDYKKQHEWSQNRDAEIRKLTKKEATTIQFEMLIYIKIWEMDSFIKKIYQLTRLIYKEEYDWHFAITGSNRNDSGTGKREEIIRKKVRDKLKDSFPLIYNAIKNAYKTQLRNSISHSKYSMPGRYIHLNNYIENDKSAQLQVVSFDEWIDIIHDTLVFYSQVSRLREMIDTFYHHVATQNDNEMEIRITKKYPSPSTEYHLLKHRPEFNDWYWKANEQQS